MASTVADTAPSAADSEEVEVEAPGFFRIYKNGRFERFAGTDRLPAGLDPETGVNSKDTIIDHTTGVSVRLFLPQVATGRKLPLLVYFHGGAFFLGSSASPIYHRHLNALSSLTPLIAVSVDYRLAPEHPLPAAYEDSWTALRWVFNLPDPWLSDHADLNRVFVAGDSAGANISHHMALRAREESVARVTIKGVALIHPFFWGSEPVGSETTDPGSRSPVEKRWQSACPNSTGPDDPRINPMAVDAPGLASLGCQKLLLTVAERDALKHRGKVYYEKLKESGWGGEAELVETPDSEHVFHLFNPDTEKAKDMVGRSHTVSRIITSMRKKHLLPCDREWAAATHKARRLEAVAVAESSGGYSWKRRRRRRPNVVGKVAQASDNDQSWTNAVVSSDSHWRCL